MSQSIIPYVDGAGTKWAVAEEQANECLLNDYAQAQESPARSAPFGLQYDDLAGLQAFGAGWEAVEMAPPGLVLRRLNLGLSDYNASGAPSGTSAVINAASVVVGDIATFNALFPTGDTPFPEVPTTLLQFGATIIAAQGESRNSN